jgi:hypothetical protein
MKQAPPIAVPRPRASAWTKRERLRFAQIASNRQREPAKVTLAKAPWEEEENKDGLDNIRLRDVLR